MQKKLWNILVLTTCLSSAMPMAYAASATTAAADVDPLSTRLFGAYLTIRSSMEENMGAISPAGKARFMDLASEVLSLNRASLAAAPSAETRAFTEIYTPHYGLNLVFQFKKHIDLSFEQTEALIHNVLAFLDNADGPWGRAHDVMDLAKALNDAATTPEQKAAAAALSSTRIIEIARRGESLGVSYGHILPLYLNGASAGTADVIAHLEGLLDPASALSASEKGPNGRAQIRSYLAKRELSSATAEGNHNALNHLKAIAEERKAYVEPLSQTDTLATLLQRLPVETQAFVLERHETSKNHAALLSLYKKHRESFATKEAASADLFLGNIRLKLQSGAMEANDMNLLMQIAQEYTNLGDLDFAADLYAYGYMRNYQRDHRHCTSSESRLAQACLNRLSATGDIGRRLSLVLPAINAQIGEDQKGWGQYINYFGVFSAFSRAGKAGNLLGLLGLNDVLNNYRDSGIDVFVSQALETLYRNAGGYSLPRDHYHSVPKVDLAAALKDLMFWDSDNAMRLVDAGFPHATQTFVGGEWTSVRDEFIHPKMPSDSLSSYSHDRPRVTFSFEKDAMVATLRHSLGSYATTALADVMADRDQLEALQYELRTVLSYYTRPAAPSAAASGGAGAGAAAVETVAEPEPLTGTAAAATVVEPETLTGRAAMEATIAARVERMHVERLLGTANSSTTTEAYGPPALAAVVTGSYMPTAPKWLLDLEAQVERALNPGAGAAAGAGGASAAAASSTAS